MNNINAKADLTAAFQQLRERFAAGLAERSAAMVHALEHPADDGMLTQLIDLAHKLAGGCGTFGFAALGNQARQIEALANAINAKTPEQQKQSLPALTRAVLEFDMAVAKAQQNENMTNDFVDSNLLEPNTVWLMLDDNRLVSELTQQLNAFGHQVEHFDNFDSLLKRLQTSAPAVLLSNIQLQNSHSLFSQKFLLNQLAKHQSRLMLYSTSDSFDLRIKAAQYHADAFFVSPLDIPNMIAATSELLEQLSGKPGRVFIVDDDKLLAEHYALVLTAVGIETRILSSVHNIIDELMRFQPDLLLMDMYMPDYSGTELAGLIRQYRSLRRLPIVFLSSETNKQLQVRAMAHGADDFITKPIEDTYLAQLVKIRLVRSKQIKNLIEKDSLTSLVKHSAIKELAEMEFERAARSKQPLAVVMLDIDRFKSVNDNYGHAIGDLVITALATLLRKRIRKTDRAGRYGGEEFLLVLPDCDSEQAVVLVEKILAVFRTLQFSATDKLFYCTFSAGVTSTMDNQYSSAEQMIADADEALYRAKNNGRDQVSRFKK